MAQTIIADMDSWKRIAGDADADGAFTPLVRDKDVIDLLGKVLTALMGIRARLDAGIKTQTVATVGTVSV